MRIAIHHRNGSFSERWIAYCKEENISFKIVNCFDTDIISQLKDCDALLWHHHHTKFKDVLAADNILFALEQAGVVVFPDFNTAWHFDDKVAQKYLLEAVDAPIVKSYVFYEKQDALIWARSTSYPKVFKLKRGAGSTNVRLVKTLYQAERVIKKSFGRGFPQLNRRRYFIDSVRHFDSGADKLGILKGLYRILFSSPFSRMSAREKGYVYFQNFIPDNNFDTRVIVIGNKAFGLKRLNRKHDFRASGSGKILYEKDQINIACVKVAFETNQKLRSQSIAFDFVFDNEKPEIVEISYAYAVGAYDQCPGYWDADLEWHAGKFNPQEWMIQNLIADLKIRSK